MRILLCLLLLMGAQLVSAQDTLAPRDTSSFFAKAERKISAKRNWLLGIQLNRTPETGFLTGVHYVQFFKMGRDTTLRTSNLDFTFSITEKKQIVVLIVHCFQFLADKLRIQHQ